jgi:ABC-type lipoprotein export system ATPase subunit
MLGIVGASGSGKSTLLNMLGGLDRPSAGRVVVDGRDLIKLSDRVLDRYRRTGVGFVWQQVARNLIPYLSARQNVELPMTVAGMGLRVKRARSRELLERVGLWEHRRHLPAQLSGGQQQRIAIAVALANQPKLLLADEPTGEVDSATAQGLYELFHELNGAYGLTIIIVSHDPQIARRVDRVVAIRDGRTSTETIRRVSQLERAIVGGGIAAEGVAARGAEAQELASRGAGAPGLVTQGAADQETEVYQEYVVLDSAGRLQVPREYLEQLNIGDRVTLEVTDDAIQIRPVAGRGSVAAPLLTGLDDDDPPPLRRRGLRRWWAAIRRRRGP